MYNITRASSNGKGHEDDCVAPGAVARVNNPTSSSHASGSNDEKDAERSAKRKAHRELYGKSGPEEFSTSQPPQDDDVEMNRKSKMSGFPSDKTTKGGSSGGGAFASHAPSVYYDDEAPPQSSRSNQDRAAMRAPDMIPASEALPMSMAAVGAHRVGIHNNGFDDDGTLVVGYSQGHLQVNATEPVVAETVPDIVTAQATSVDDVACYCCGLECGSVAPSKRSTRRRWYIAGGVSLLLLIVVIIAVVASGGGGSDGDGEEATIPPIGQASPSPTRAPTSEVPTAGSDDKSQFFCGSDWFDAVEHCHQHCPSGTGSECTQAGHRCFADTSCNAFPTVGSTAAPTAGPASNPTRFPTRWPTQAPTPSPTEAPTTPSPTALVTKEFFTTLNYTHAYYGHMFDITALKDIRVVSMEFQTISTLTETIEVWTKEDTYVGEVTEQFRWAQLGQASVRGQGQGSLTSLPRDLFGSEGVRVRAGKKQSFYIVAQTEIICFQERKLPNGTDLISYGERVYGNEDMDINVGTGVQYRFVNNGPPNVFNGLVEYVVEDDGNDEGAV